MFLRNFYPDKIGVPTFVVVTFLAYIYLKFLKRGYFKSIFDEPVNHGRLNLISWGLAALCESAITTFFTVTKLWFDFLQFINSTSFGKKDPLYDMDISFYAFKLDFIEEVNQIVLVLLIAFAVLTVIYYSILLTVRTPKIFEEKAQAVDEEEEQSQAQGGAGNGFDNLNGMFGKFTEAFTGKAGGGFKRPSRTHRSFDNQNLKMLVSIAEKQLIIVGVLFFLMVGVNFFLKQYDLLFGSTGAVHGAGFTDVNITLWMYRIIMVLAVFAAVGFAVGISRRHIKPAVVAPIIMIIIEWQEQAQPL